MNSRPTRSTLSETAASRLNRNGRNQAETQRADIKAVIPDRAARVRRRRILERLLEQEQERALETERRLDEGRGQDRA